MVLCLGTGGIAAAIVCRDIATDAGVEGHLHESKMLRDVLERKGSDDGVLSREGSGKLLELQGG